MQRVYMRYIITYYGYRETLFLVWAEGVAFFFFSLCVASLALDAALCLRQRVVSSVRDRL